MLISISQQRNMCARDWVEVVLLSDVKAYLVNLLIHYLGGIQLLYVTCTK